MESIKIGKAFIPLVERFIQVDNYDKMKSILDIGFSGIDMIEKYSKMQNINFESNVIFQEEIKKYKLMIKEIENKNLEIKKEKEEIENKFFDIKQAGYNERENVRNELDKKLQSEVEIYRKQIKQINDEKMLLITTFEELKNKEVEKRTKFIQEEKEKLEKENKFLKQLYEGKSKGTEFENKLIPLFEEYNNKYLNNKWRILHIGSSCSHKCDFHIKNKDTGDIILIDTKNNESHKPVVKDDIDKFIYDVTLPENNAIGGILIANNKICKKKNFDVSVINKKILYYVSNCSIDNIAFIFTMIDTICDKNKKIKSGFDEESQKEDMLEDYSFLTERLNNNEKEKKIYVKKINELKNKFYRFFNDDIELCSKGIINLEEKMEQKVNKKDKEIYDFDELEKGCKVVGKNRTRYFLKFKENGQEKIQYFSSNHPKNVKLNKLKKKENVEFTIDV